MRQLLRDNQYFLYFFVLWLLLAGYFLVNLEKGDVLLFLNKHRSAFWDVFFIWATKLAEEYIYILVIIGSLFIRFRYAILFALMGGLVALVSFLAKLFFAYDRPFTFFDKKGLIESINFIDGVYILKGTTSFPSGHTMSAFAIYGLIYLLLTDKKIWAFPLFLLALLVGISRIYLVHHFLMDVYLGSVLGLLIAFFVFSVEKSFFADKFDWMNKKIIRK